MLYTHEVIEFKNDVPIKIFIQKLEDIPGHWHKSIEIFFVLSGKLKITTDAETYYLSEEDIVLINSNQLHEIQSSESIVIILQIKLSYFKEWLSESAYFRCNSTISYNKSEYLEMKRLLARLVNVNYNHSGYNDLLTISLAYNLLHELIRNFRGNDEKSVDNNSKNLKRLRNIIQYLNDNYMENITLNSIAEREFLSASYLSHFFEKNMKVSLFTYLTEIRLNHAVNDLQTTNLTIEQIAANNGFANSRYFVSSFKKQFGMLPKDYRKSQKQDKSAQKPSTVVYNDYLLMDQHEFLNKLGKYLDSNTGSSPETVIKPAMTNTLEVNVKNHLRILNHTFKTFTGVGRAKEILMRRLQDELKILQQEVGFRYIKFHGILDDSMMLYNEDNSGNPFLTFTYVDEVIDYLLSVNLKPLIQFSFMPRKLAKNPPKTIFYNSVFISEPNNLEKWSYLITNLTRHFIERYGKDEVRKWLFSFWNVPYKPSVFSFETNETGYDLYKITRSCVKSCDNLLRFGNPSFSSIDLNGSDVHNFMEFCRKNNCFPDFYNINCYPVKEITSKELTSVINNPKEAPQKNTVVLSEDPDYVSQAINSFKAGVAPYPRLPVYITEMSSTSSHRDWLNDTCYRSSYIVKNILENYDSVDSFGNWCLSDTLEELPLDNDIFHGELGLFTTNGIKKPAYYAFTFLNKLYDTLLASGNGYFITTNQSGDFSVILYNYIHISPLYAQGILFNVNFLERYNAFTNPASLDLQFTLAQLDNGAYIITEQIVNREYGSAFDEWVRMGGFPLMTEEEVNILKGHSMPKIIKSCLQVTDSNLHYTAKLKPHEIRLVQIKKQLW